MVLSNVTVFNRHDPVDVQIEGETITGVHAHAGNRQKGNIVFSNAIAFPGLINSHDHLDFNCFSPLGNKTYADYTEWGPQIHSKYKTDIDAVLQIPQSLRTRWGMYKNLIAGVTTVVNHGVLLHIEQPLINVLQHTQNLHSVKFQQHWKWKLNNPLLKNNTCVIHIGEGGNTAHAEIDELLKWNLLNRKLVGVHGVAMNERQAQKFEGLVWCPESNNVLLKKHADIMQLKKATRVVFGTDATLTGSWNIWAHLRLARCLQMTTDEELFTMTTRSPADLWRINTGRISPGTDADVVVAATNSGNAGWNDFYSINPSDILMVLHKGKIRVYDASMHNQLQRFLHGGLFSPVRIGKAVKYVEGNLQALATAIKNSHPGAQLGPLSDSRLKCNVYD